MVCAQSQSSPILYGSVRLGAESPEATPSIKVPEVTIPHVQPKKIVIQKISPPPENPRMPPKKTNPYAAGAFGSLAAKRLDSQLWTGKTFDKKLATKLLVDPKLAHHVWKNIPDWRAGGWQCSQETNTRWQKYVNGKTTEQKPLGAHLASGAESIGLQKDSFGNIWDEFGGGYWQEMDYGTDKGRTYVKFRLPGNNNGADYVAESVEFDIDKRTNKIKSVQQRKTQSRSSYVAPNVMKEEEAHVIYDEKGQPIEAAWNTILLNRIKPFGEVESERADFVRYLTASGLQSLIPGGSLTARKNSAQKKPLQVK
jgi:hypothetical protein